MRGTLRDILNLYYSYKSRVFLYGGRKMKTISKMKVLFTISIIVATLVIPIMTTKLDEMSKGDFIVIHPTTLTLSYIDENGEEFEMLGAIRGDWSDPSSGATLLWGQLPIWDTGTYRDHDWIEYKEANYGWWLNRLKVKWGFSDIPSGYDWYHLSLYYCEGEGDEYLTVTWDGDSIDSELLTSSWTSTSYEFPGVVEYDISYDDAGDIIYQDYTSYYQVMDWDQSIIRLSVPYIYAWEY